MGVEYSRFLIPVPASYVPTKESVVKLIDALQTDKWLPGSNSPSLQAIRHKLPDRSGTLVDALVTPRLFGIIPWFTKGQPSKWHCQLPRYVETPQPIDPAFIAARIEDGGLLLRYGVRNFDRDVVKYPLARLDYERQDTYYDLQFWWSEDFIYLTSQTLEGFDSTNCHCGFNLVFKKEVDVFAPDEHMRLICPKCKIPFNPNERVFRICDGYTGEGTEIEGGAVFRFAIEIDCGKCIPNSSVEFAPEFRDLCSSMLQCDFLEVESIH